MNAENRILSILKVMPVLLILNADSLLAAFEWPWQQATEQKAKTSNVPASPSPSPVMAQQSTDASFNAGQQMNQKANALQSGASNTSKPIASSLYPRLSQPSVPVAKDQGQNRGQNSFTILAPPRNTNYEEAVRMQAKLNDLLRITSDMDRVNRSKIAAVQSMVDKARANQKLLTSLASPSNANAKIRKVDADQILLSKKLRGMREEAEKKIALAQSNNDHVPPSAQAKP